VRHAHDYGRKTGFEVQTEFIRLMIGSRGFAPVNMVMSHHFHARPQIWLSEWLLLTRISSPSGSLFGGGEKKLTFMLKQTELTASYK